jgi:transcription initiation factor TFIID subunit 2
MAMATLRNMHNICPPEVVRFLLDLFKYNDNGKNKVSLIHFAKAKAEISLQVCMRPCIKY